MIKFHASVKIITRDNNDLYAIHKPINIKSIPNTKKAEKNALIFAEYDHKNRCYHCDDNEKFFILNRLDSPTSGVMLGCNHIDLARAIRESFQKHNVIKKYIAITAFRSIPTEGIWKSTVNKINNKTNVRVINGGNLLAITKYKVLKEISIYNEKFLLLSLNPITGRTHQLRMHCAMNNLPILGDKTYGNFKLNDKMFKKFPNFKKRLYLHSQEIRLEYKYNDKTFKFLAEDTNTEDFDSIIDYK